MPQRAYDFAWERPRPDDLKALGTTEVFRYLSYDNTGKNLTLAEAQAYAAAGIRCSLYWEYAPKAALMGHDQGVHDAEAAMDQVGLVLAPHECPILFAVDFDIPDYAPGLPNDDDPGHNRAKLGPVAGYFDGVASSLQQHSVGAYGGYWAIRRLFRAGLIEYGQQTYAWSGDGRGGTLWDSRAQSRQVANGVNDVAGMQLDRCEIWAPTGAWFPGGQIPPPPPKPAPEHPTIPNYTPGSRTLWLTSPMMVGADVGYLQRFIGPRQCGAADNVYGPHTAAGVTWYEQMRGIKVESPGIAGPQVWANILHGG